MRPLLAPLLIVLAACASGRPPGLPFPPPDPGATAVPAVNTQSRQAVLEAYQAYYKPGESAQIGFTGNVSACDAGTTALSFRQATIRRVNFYRALAGLPGVELDEPLSRKAQQAALMMAANNKLSHSPGSDWKCYTPEGREAAGKSNLYGGYREGPGAVAAYMEDFGNSNAAVGHRRWVLFPPQKRMGTGDVPGSNALWVIGVGGSRPSSPEFVAWPPPGFVPRQVLPSSSERWSFGMAGANFADATVSVLDGTTALPTAKESSGGGYGDPTLVWRVELPATSEEKTYTVKIEGVTVGGARRSFTYSVTPFDAEKR